MRVLWFSITPAKYGKYATNGGGWIEALQRVVTSEKDVDLGIAFIDSQERGEEKVCYDGTTYYPMHIQRNGIQKWFDKYTYKKIDQLTIKRCVEIISDYRPDIIQVFGSEWCFGLISAYTDVPVVIHMQGCWIAYDNTNSLLKNSFFFIFLQRLFKPRRLLNYMLNEHISKERAEREERILAQNKYFMGRTIWDEALVRLYAPNSKYFYCSEALRSSFISCNKRWRYQDREKRIFVTTGLAVELKGYDVVLKAARLLRDKASFDFDWLLFGPTKKQMKLYEYKTGILCDSVGVKPCGLKPAEYIQQELLSADCYIHPSYIDNSPNAVCEAQYLGLPVIATKVGGTSSLFAQDYDKNLLIAANDPYHLASSVISLMQSAKKMTEAGESNYITAHQRHNDSEIRTQLMSVYKSILNEGETCHYQIL